MLITAIRKISPVAVWRDGDNTICAGHSWVTFKDERGVWLRISGRSNLAALHGVLARVIYECISAHVDGQDVCASAMLVLAGKDVELGITGDSVSAHLRLRLEGKGYYFVIQGLTELAEWLQLVCGAPGAAIAKNSVSFERSSGVVNICFAGQDGKSCRTQLADECLLRLKDALLGGLDCHGFSNVTINIGADRWVHLATHGCYARIGLAQTGNGTEAVAVTRSELLMLALQLGDTLRDDGQPVAAAI